MVDIPPLPGTEPSRTQSAAAEMSSARPSQAAGLSGNDARFFCWTSGILWPAQDGEVASTQDSSKAVRSACSSRGASGGPAKSFHVYLPVNDRLIRVTTSSQSRSSLAG